MTNNLFICSKRNKNKNDTIYLKLCSGYYLEIMFQLKSIDGYMYSLSESMIDEDKNLAVPMFNMILYYPPDGTSFKNQEIEDDLLRYVTENKSPANTTSPKIGMICNDGKEFYLKDFYIKKDYSLVDADLHYGKGFEEFYAKLVEKMKRDSKGLVLFYGAPGCGKTWTIRSLIKDLTKIGKFVVYLPPSLVEMMTDPGMMNFLSSTLMSKASEGKSCVLLLEDAESLLISRKMENRSAGITNLLNITDGLLNLK